MKAKFAALPKIARLAIFAVISVIFVCCVLIGVSTTTTTTSKSTTSPNDGAINTAVIETAIAINLQGSCVVSRSCAKDW